MKRYVIAAATLAVVIGVLLPTAAAATSTAVTVTAGKPSEFAFKLSKTSVKVGKVVFTVKNSGQLPHDFKICSSNKGGKANSCSGTVTKVLSPGKSATLSKTFTKTGTYEYLCTVAGHAAAGMKGTLKVT